MVRWISHLYMISMYNTCWTVQWVLYSSLSLSLSSSFSEDAAAGATEFWMFFFFPILDWFIIEHILTRGNNQKPPQLFTVVNEYKYRWKITQTLTNHLCTMYYVLDNFIRNSLLLLLPDIEASVADIESKGSLIHSWFKLQNMVTW